MTQFLIEKFYLFFQGVLLFQTFFLGMLYFITKRKDILFYSIFLLLSAIYFFLNAPNTFFNLNDNAIFNSAIYLQGNIPLIIIANLFYILFLKNFFSGIYNSKFLEKIFFISFLSLPVLMAAFFICRYFNVETQPVFYIVNLLATCVSIFIIDAVFRQGLRNTGWVAWGMIFNILGTALTIAMIVLERYKIRNIFTVDYPLFFMRCGILADMFFYQIALLKKWHLQEKQLAVQRLEKELAVEKVRNQISSQLHDDIGSTLSGVSMYSHLIHTQMEKGEHDKAKGSLHIIQQSANEIVEKLNDLVWSVNPGQDSFPMMLERLQQYGLDMCSAKNIQFKMETPPKTSIVDLPSGQRYQLYLFIKEVINNAVKYSDATLLTLTVKENKRLLEFSIIDNGKGFDIDTIKRGNGLNNMQKRADELGAEFSIQSKAGKGCIISLKVKIT